MRKGKGYMEEVGLGGVMMISSSAEPKWPNWHVPTIFFSNDVFSSSVENFYYTISLSLKLFYPVKILGVLLIIR